MRRLIMSRLIWIYVVCRSLLLSPVAVKELREDGFSEWRLNPFNSCLPWKFIALKYRNYPKYSDTVTAFRTFFNFPKFEQCMTKPTKWHTRLAKISLGIRPVWSVFAVRIKKGWVLSYPLSAQRRLIRLGGCPDCSESSLGAHAIL